VLNEPNQRQHEMWQIDKMAQKAPFDTADISVTCEDVAVRDYLTSQNMEPDSVTLECPHRASQVINLAIHERPYLVRGDITPLAKGLCFSNEPILVLAKELRVHLEDHLYMTGTGVSNR